MNTPHIQRFAIGPFALLLVSGTPEQVLDHVEKEVADKRTLVSAAVRKDDKKAMVMYTSEAIDNEAIPAQLMKSILGGYERQDWNFFNLIGYVGSKLDVAVGSKLLAAYKPVQKFAGRLAKQIFTKDGYLAGSPDNTRVLMLIGPDGDRIAYAWNYETADNVVIDQPFDLMTRYSVVGKNLVALLEGTNQIATLPRKSIGKLLNGEDSSWQNHELTDGFEIDDLSIGTDNGDNVYTLVATGKLDGKKVVQAITAIYADGEMELMTAGELTELEDSCADYGSVVRSDDQSTTFVNYNGGKDAVTFVPTHLLPQKVQQTLRAA
ncbi:hypothetical protein CO174_05195 [Candidatus Uhrbacteria bacterium CG_4_9_14_3_um_filter_50_9]|uniref:Uncharacterized protein n=1 Tax=Candidatus Uhrbacteria bacterium CG_4_9_14_3_um_filter_50_9 TaxID=1975035 RepID=A0A2M7XAY4_9BACT|nr:MAG: hypothetical protein CO174_05195 [Candidatus Uhrbacteria bacterium CG_4_9_14_3_um_filter_50_9]